ncbi:acyl carrier protein [Pseudorhodoferax sp. Leaf274]|uniref:acyl carrier protein n=1 Tax=Pseudorhodoferax sp. Leaf274 TaxID=1736318 RepID=UPI0007032258|nr:phosphopantetheine-binding protein [Pseudorhodoferax sp. Leaf274]KQP39779.1 acyl carrier protein [Pseudorhodoferax sp. Leaf274]
MSVLPDVLHVLDETLGLGGRSAGFDADTPLLDALPELDSMAIVSLISALEQHFGVMLPDDELDGRVFATAGSLADFLDDVLHRTQ